ncbi:PTS fructose transporter subunit IIB [Coriobacteriales bacterium OH1046]|nr:PTS fructose transporter subunit IIB [Coriobacteriales bacterium OH1046]
MKIVAVTACTVGVAHTYIARDKLEAAAVKRGHAIQVETQGNVGIEDELSPEAIRDADIVILAADVTVAHQERFARKKVVRVPSVVAIKQADQLIGKIEDKLGVK